MEEYQVDKAEPAASEVSLISQKTRQLLARVPLTGVVPLRSPDNRFLPETSAARRELSLTMNHITPPSRAGVPFCWVTPP